MKKDYIRDYATEAFRFWASCGCPSMAQATERLRERVMKENADKPERAVIIAEEAVAAAQGELLDIMAVNETMRLLTEYGRSDIAQAVAAVYCYDSKRKVSRGEITRRVVKHSLACHMSERNVYRSLAKARALFASLRGLRCDVGIEELLLRLK